MESSEIIESQSFNHKFNAAANFLIHSPVNSPENPNEETQCQNYVKDTQYSEEPCGQVEYSVSTVLETQKGNDDNELDCSHESEELLPINAIFHSEVPDNDN